MLVAVSVAAATLPLTWGIARALDSALDLEPSLLNALGTPAIWVSITATIAAGCLVGVLLARPPAGRRAVMIAATLGALAGATPMSVVLFFRFQFSGCVGLNFFGVPWPEPWQTLAQLVCVSVVLGVAVLTVTSFAIRSLRWVAVAVLGWLVVATIPTFFVFFISVFGDPGPGCVIR